MNKTTVYRITRKWWGTYSMKVETSVDYTEDASEALRAVAEDKLVEVMKDDQGFQPIDIRINGESFETRHEITDEEFEPEEEEVNAPKSILP